MGKICCFTGHRKITDNENELYLSVKSEVLKLCEEGYSEFRCGGAVGFDMLCADAVIEARKQYPEIRFVIYVPCLEQNKFFTDKQKVRYKAQIDAADKILCISERYYSGCMLDRNKAMVRGSDLCIAYLRKNTGGTAFTVRFAEENRCQVKII